MAETTTLAPWTPKEAKGISIVVKSFIWLAIIAGGAFAIKTFVPTITDAVNLLAVLVSSFTSMAISLGVFVFVLWLLSEIFSKDGKIGKLLRQAYSSAIRSATMELISYDPMSPLYDQKSEMGKKQAEFDDAYKSFDGMIASLTRTRDDFSKQSEQHKGRWMEAQRRVQAGEMDYQTSIDTESHAYGSFKDSAARFDGMINNLVPVRANLKKLRETTLVIISNLDIDIQVLSSEWAAQKKLSSMDASARSLLNGTDRKELAKTAQQFIQDRYSTSIGQLNNLADVAKPLIQSIDLDKGSYNQELLNEFNAQFSTPVQVVTPSLAAPGLNTGIPMNGVKSSSLASALLKD